MNRTGPGPAASLLALTTLLVVLAACSTDASVTGSSTNDESVGATADSPTTAATDDGTVGVTIESFRFAPNPITIGVGDSVTWTNEDWVGHTVTARDGSFKSGMFYSDDSVTVTFATAGTFLYFCSVPTHRSMSGTVIVK